MARPKKRSITIKTHKTSVSLEEDFWVGLQEIASQMNVSVGELVSRIDQARDAETGLATAIRVHVFRHFRD